MDKQTIARLLLQPNKNFPIDCETIDSLQTNIAVVQVLGNLVGDKAILYGCEPEQNGTRRKAGYVFLRTKDYPAGEVILWEGGNISGGMYVNQEVVAVTAQGYEFPQAYTVRSLSPGVGVENYSWGDFKLYKTPRELETYIQSLETTIAKLAPPPLGIVQMWAGSKVPEGYELCDGRELKISEYGDLYAVIGTTFNCACSSTGSVYSTTSGYFRLPDLRGRFIAGYNVGDVDYNTFGKVGGEKQHRLSTSEMPSHAHSFKDYYYIEHHDSVSKALSGLERTGGNLSGSGKSDSDNDTLLYYNHDTNSSGYGYAHENRPPYYVLAYIMRMK